MDRNPDSRVTPKIAEVMSDPSASFWIKMALKTALQRDAVDAANDARLVAALLDQRAQGLLSASGCGPRPSAS